jgi:hypothetical protein
MTRCSVTSRKQASILTALHCLLACSFAGCGNASREVTVCECRILIDGQPAQDVRVVLASKTDVSSGTLEGVTDHAGVAAMKLIGSPPPSGELRAYVESLGDWHIIKPWSDPKQSPLTATWNGDATLIEIEVPKKAVKLL